MIVTNQSLVEQLLSKRPHSERACSKQPVDPIRDSLAWFAQPHHQAKQQDIAQRLTKICQTKADRVQANKQVPSPDGRWLAQPLLDPTTDLQRWQISQISLDGESVTISETVSNVYPTGIAWRPNSSGFFYDRYLPYPGVHALYFHKLGTDQDGDRCVFYRPEHPDWRYQPFISPDSRWLAISITNGTACNQIYLFDLTQNKPVSLISVIDCFVGRYDILAWESDRLILRAVEPETPNGRLVAIDLEQPGNRLTTILTTTHLPLLDGVPLGDGWLASYLDGGCAKLRWLDGQGEQKQTIPLPGYGTVAGLVADPQSGKVEFGYTDHAWPWQRFSWQPGDQRPTPLPISTRSSCQPERFVTRHHGVISLDGVVVPIFVTYRRDIVLTDRPTLINAYGGMGVSLTPRFSADSFAWLEMGGIFVTVCARGGGELGAAWHQAAVGVNKQRTFDDVLAVIRWLHSQGITSPARTGLWGSSNGGLTAGACLTQAPELFGAVVIEAGLLDMLNYHRMGRGVDWLAEYGSPDLADQRAVLTAYSPLHNIVLGTNYPATLITTSDHDPRVGEAHSYRFAEALQTAHAGLAPVLLHVSAGTGHGDQLSSQQWLNSASDRLTFFAIQLDL